MSEVSSVFAAYIPANADRPFCPLPRFSPTSRHAFFSPISRLADEQEYLRIGAPYGYISAVPNRTIDDIIDPATLRELYTSPFAEAIRAGAGSIMSSYNKINGTFASEDQALLMDLLKTEVRVSPFFSGSTRRSLL